MDPETLAMLNYWLAQQTQLDPTMQGMLGGLISPNVNKKGELDQFGLDLEKSNLNQYQDIYGSFANPMNSLLAGVGSFGSTPTGGGIVGGGGLNPITTESILETPTTRRYQQLADRALQGGQVTPETYIANMLVNNQADPSVIVADLQAKMADPNLDAATKNLFNSWLPRIEKKDMQGNPSGEFVTDWNAAAAKIEKAAEPYLTEQTTLSGPNIGQNSYGQYVQYSEQPSEMMQYLQKLGLPDPRAQYGIDFSIQSDPQLAELMTNIGAKGQAFDQARQTYEKYLKDKPVAQTMARLADEMKGRREDQYRQQMIDFVRQQAEAGRNAGITPDEAAQAAADARNREGTPGWMKGIGGAISGAVTGLPGEINDALARVAGKPIAPRGAPRTPTNVNIFPEPGRPTPPAPPTMRGPSLIEQMYARMNSAPDRQYQLAGEMNRASQAQGEDMLAMVRAIAPGYGAMRAGRSPFKDAIMQRLQPILAVGGARR